MSFVKGMNKNIGEKTTNNLIGKHSQKLVDYAKQSAADALKTASKRPIQKIAEGTGDLIGNKIADKTINVSKSSQQDNSHTVTNEHDNELPKERYISPEKRQKIVDDLRLI